VVGSKGQENRADCITRCFMIYIYIYIYAPLNIIFVGIHPVALEVTDNKFKTCQVQKFYYIYFNNVCYIFRSYFYHLQALIYII
jgi:hypothetical protein